MENKVLFDQSQERLVAKNTIEVLTYKLFDEFGERLKAFFTTRHGGVSSAPYNTLNLSFTRGDNPENVKSNFRILSEALGIEQENMVLSAQVHENKVRVVYKADAGKGITKFSDITGIDGLVTNEKGIALITFYADCTPVYLYDPEMEVIGLSHAGWKSTIKDIMGETIKVMKSEFGCKPDHIKAVIGPRIRHCCFEVDSDVYEAYLDVFSWSSEYIDQIGDKWYIDNGGIIRKRLLELGLLEESIADSSLCTKCRKDTFFSHRGDLGKSGCQIALMQLI